MAAAGTYFWAVGKLLVACCKKGFEKALSAWHDVALTATVGSRANEALKQGDTGKVVASLEAALQAEVNAKVNAQAAVEGAKPLQGCVSMMIIYGTLAVPAGPSNGCRHA